MDLRDAIKKRREHEAQFAERQVLFAGIIQIGPNGTPFVPGTYNHNWVQPTGTGEVVPVFNRRMKDNLVGAGAVCGFEPFSSVLEILYSDPSMTAGVVPVAGLDVPNHWETHLIDGPDPVPVYTNAIFVLLTYTLGLTGVVVNVSSYVYQADDGTIVTFAGQENLDLSSHVPAVGLARYVLIYLDLATNALVTLAGATTVDSPSFAPTPPLVPPNSVPSSLVRLAGGQTIVAHRDIVPVQDYLFSASRVQTGLLDMLAIQENEFDLALTLHAVNGY